MMLKVKAFTTFHVTFRGTTSTQQEERRMNRRILCFLAAVAFVFVSASMSMAENAILSSLENQGVTIKMMDDTALDSVRGGTDVLTGALYPSTLTSIKKHQVTWNHYGSQSDYRQYNYVGASWVPNSYASYIYNGNEYYVVGDQYLADMTSTGSTWVQAYATVIDNHLQILDPNTLAVTPYAFRDNGWNRPLGTFTW